MTEDATEADFRQRFRQQQSNRRVAVRNFVHAVETGDVEAMLSARAPIDVHMVWRGVLQRCARLESVSSAIQRAWLEMWCSDGDHLRGETGDDRVLMAALRVLLPRYSGPAMTLYRGEIGWNRRRRSYGISWTSREEVAESFAQGMFHRCAKGGSLVIRASVPPEAILCAPLDHRGDEDWQEAEYLVDRRKLRAVIVVRRYPQMNIDEWTALHHPTAR